MPDTLAPLSLARVPIIDSRTGLVDRAWYMFFLSLRSNLGNVTDDNALAPLDAGTGGEGQKQLDSLAVADTASGLVSQTTEMQKQLDAVLADDVLAGLVSQVAEMQKQLEAAELANMSSGLLAQLAVIQQNLTASAPSVKTADFAVVDTDLWLINNKSGSSCVVTLPSAALFPGRPLHFQNYQAQTLVSASSNVVPLTGGSAGTSILLAVSGDSATIVSNGSNWLMTQYIPNNALLLN